MIRRAACGIALAAAALAAGACGSDGVATKTPSAIDSDARLVARERGGRGSCAQGEHELRLTPGRRALMLVTQPGPTRKRALLLALHGAGSGGAPGGLHAFRGAWDLPGLVIVAPAAAGNGWSLGSTDVRFVDQALGRAFARCPIDPVRVAVGGFSSGAGMALWLGLANGDLFASVIALSGGGVLPGEWERVGKPRVFVAHGRRDAVIPIEAGGDRVVGGLRAAGYDVDYRRFDGGHRVVPAIARGAVARVLPQSGTR